MYTKEKSKQIFAMLLILLHDLADKYFSNQIDQTNKSYAKHQANSVYLC